MSYSEEFLDKTIKVWQPYSKKFLTHEDAREIAKNMVAFINFLKQLDEKHTPMHD
jgi:hypothetical protein